MGVTRTTIVYLLLLSVIGHNCDNLDEFKSEVLLRGSNEDVKLDEFDTPFRNLEPDGVDGKEVEATTEFPITTEELKDFEETTTIPPLDANIVDKIENSFDFGNNDTVTDPTTSTSLPPTTTTGTTGADVLEAIEPGVASLDDERDPIISPRVPKLNDNVEPRQQDRRNFETKSATPAASKSVTLKNWLQDSWLRPPPGILVPLRPMALSRALAVWNDLTAEGLNVTDIIIVGYDANGVNWRSRHSLRPGSSSAGQRTVAEAFAKLLLKYQDVSSDANSDSTMKAIMTAAKLVPYDSALFVVTDKGAGDSQRLPLAIRALVEKRLKVYTIWTDPKYPSEESEQQLQGLKNISKHTEGDVLPYSRQVMEVDQNTEPAFERLEVLETPQARKGRVQALMEEEKMDTLLVRRGGGEAISLGVPVENGVTALRVYIEGLVEHAVLYPPNDAPQIDLYNESSVLAFSPRSRTEALSPRDVYLAFPGTNDIDMLTVVPMRTPGPGPGVGEGAGAMDAPAPTVGVWHLSVRCDTCDYRLRVSARGPIHFAADIHNKDSMKVRVVGPVASVRESVLIDEYGTELATLPFSYQPQTIAADGQETPAEGQAELIAEMPIPNVKGSNVFAKIVGRDVRGEPFVRLSGPLDLPEIRTGRSASISFPDTANELVDSDSYMVSSRLRYNESTVLPYGRAMSTLMNQFGAILTSVQIGLGTRLYAAPGETLQLYFEVTNHREQATRFTFQAVGELRLLRGINPTSQYLAAGQIANVIVTVGITSSVQPGSRDLITFTAIDNNNNQVSISTYVYVTNLGQAVTDVWPPELRHNFQGSCIGRLGDDCAQHIWSATVTARDTNSGLLRLTSSPIGITYDSNFVAGSREEVIGVYRSTCCAPRVVVTAVDAVGNPNSYIIDISRCVRLSHRNKHRIASSKDQLPLCDLHTTGHWLNFANAFTALKQEIELNSSYLNEASIAAIVLGVFLFIALVVLVVFLIRWCVRRRKESRELPYSTSTSRNLS